MLAVDATGVGRPVVDLLRAARLPARLVPILITGGDSVIHDEETGFYNVPKRDLVGGLAVLLQSERLKIAEALPEAATLVQEMVEFKVKISLTTAHDSYGAWREGQYDDLLLGLAVAAWAGEHIGHRKMEIR